MRVRWLMRVVWIAEDHLGWMAREANRWFPLETGGVWMGYESARPGEVVVTYVIGPGPRAVHARASFTPDAGYQLAEIERYYRASGREDTYLGDWHTHPCSVARPSQRDVEALAEIAAAPESRRERPLMGILGGGFPWRLGVWSFRGSGTASRGCAPVVVRRY